MRSFHKLLPAILIYLGLSLSYFFIVPIFEGPDEWTHTGHVNYIAAGNGLPVMLPGQGIWGGQQPPLYYVGGAILMQPFDLTAFDEYDPGRLNPHAALGYALDPGNKNLYLHHAEENFPYIGLSLAVHTLRLYSMLFGFMALILIYYTALEFGAERFPLLPLTVALFVATQPMFAFITAMVANEPANMAWCAFVVWLSQRYVQRGPTASIGRAVALGVGLGFVSLAKMTGLSVGLVAVVAFLLTALEGRAHPHVARRLWRDGLIIGLTFLLIGGWWYGRNYQLYGDFFQTGLYEIYFNDTPDPITLSHFLYVLRSSEISFWATFGWLNIIAPDWLYHIYSLILRLGLLGAFIGLLKQPWWQNRLILLHAIFPLALAFSLIRLVSIEGGMQGRQLLPALGSIALVVMWGWWQLSLMLSTLPRAKFMARLPLFLCLLMVPMAIYLPLQVVRPAYTPTPLLNETDLPNELVRLNWDYNEQLRLLGVDIAETTLKPAERVAVTAYWQVLQPMPTNYSVFVHLFGRQHEPAGQFNSYPGLGLRPTSTLQAGQIFADTYPVQLNGGTTLPARLTINLGLFDFQEAGRPGLPAMDGTGNPVGPTVGYIKGIPERWPARSTEPPLAQFAGFIELDAFRIENCAIAQPDCHINLTWVATGEPQQDYTVFIQLWQVGAPVVGFDAPPLAGDYPTSMWGAGEVIHDEHPLDLSALAAGEYELWLGLYEYQTGGRLPIVGGRGLISPDHALSLGVLTVE